MRLPRLRLRSVFALVALWALGLGVAWAAAQSPSFLQYTVGGQVQPPPTGQTTTTAGGTTTSETSTTPPPTETSTTPGVTTTDTSGAPLGVETTASQPLAAVEAVGEALPFTGSQALVGLVVFGAALAAAGLGLRRLGRQRSE